MSADLTASNALPGWIKPQLTKLVDAPPDGAGWLYEIKYDGYRLHARLDHGNIRLLTRTGLDWTHRYPRSCLLYRRWVRKKRISTGSFAEFAQMALPRSA